MNRFILSTFICSISLSLLAHEPMQINRGYLFSVEGTEGSGKTTLIKNLAEKISQLNLQVVTTREPGATKLGQKIRTMLMDRQEPICLIAEFLSFAADRAQHFAELILPHLEQNHIVISDRMADSSMVYQGYVKGLDYQTIKTINAIAMQNRTPDLVIYLQLDCQTALIRVNKRNETEVQAAFEKEILEKKQQLVDGYDAILTNRSDVIVLDATQSPENIADQAFTAILHYIQTHNE